MNSSRWARITALFHDATEQPPADRTAWLAANCDDVNIRAEVEAMLRAYDADPEFLEHATEVAAAVSNLVSSTPAGRRIGAYRLVTEIGGGGMGVVFEARRDDEEFDRRAAIKILPSWSGSDLADRFRLERRVLASLDHPGIARLLDSGTTDDGAPYFVMEYVDGKPIDVWAREHDLDVAARVALIEQVAEALAFAHQNLVIHRDVKPANILVTADGGPKLLDFGIATLLNASGEASGATRTGHHSYTPEYASPEQIRGERVTTATDVYSLGVVLYLLLSGKLPFALHGRSTLETLQIVCEVDPPLMSAVAAGEARARLRGDLDAIAAKALRKAPAERYASIAAFAADLRAWQSGRPVSAVPQSPMYRAQRFVRRHRKAVAAATALSIALAGGAAATAWQARIAALERDKAQNRFRQVREFSRSLLFDVHNALIPVPGATESRRLLLDRAVQFLDGLAADAGTDDELLLELIAGYQQLANVQGNPLSENVGDGAAAVASLEKAVALADTVRARRPGDVEALIRSISVYSDLATVMGQSSDARGMPLYPRYEALLRELEQRPNQDPGSLFVVAREYSNIGRLKSNGGDQSGAEIAYRKSVALFESLPPEAVSARTLIQHSFALKRLGGLLLRADQYDESETHYRRALAIDEEVIRLDDRPQTRYDITFTLSDLALLHSRRGHWDDAIEMWRRALTIRREAVAADPKNVRALAGEATLYGRLGGAARAQKDPLESARQYREELRIRDHLSGINSSAPIYVSEQAWARLRLAEALLECARAFPGDASRKTWIVEAEKLVRSAGRNSGKVSVPAGSEPGYLELYDQLSKHFSVR